MQVETKARIKLIYFTAKPTQQSHLNVWKSSTQLILENGKKIQSIHAKHKFSPIFEKKGKIRVHRNRERKKINRKSFHFLEQLEAVARPQLDGHLHFCVDW